MLVRLAKYCLLAAVISPVTVVPKLDLSFGKYLLFRIFVELAAVLVITASAFRSPPGLGRRVWKILHHPIIIAVLVFAAVSLISTAFAFDPAAAFWSTYSRGEGTFQLLHLCVFLILLVVLFRDRRDWTRVFLMSLVAASVSIAYGLLWPAGVATSVAPQDLPIPDNSGFWGHLMRHQFVGSIGNPIWTGAYFVFQLGYLAWLLAGRYPAGLTLKAVATGVIGAAGCYAGIIALLRARMVAGILILAAATSGVALLTRNLRIRNGIAAAMAALASLLFFFAFLLAGSRGATLGFVVAVIALAVLFLRWHWHWWLTSGVLAAILLAGALYALRSTPPLNSIRSRSFLDLTSGDYRLQYWRTAWTGFLQRPILGWGPENYGAIHDRYGRVLWPVDHAHSILFDGLATTGILGTAALLAIFGACGWALYRAVRPWEPRTSAAKVQFGILAALLASYVMQGLFTFDWLPVSLNLYLTIACLVWSSLDPVTDRAPRATRETPRILCYSAALLAVLAIGWIAYRGSYLPWLKAATFQTALDSRLETWDQCREAFNRSFLISAPFGHDELLQQFASSVAMLLREKKKSPGEVVLWETYFRSLADPVLAQGRLSTLRTLEAAAAIETAAFTATGDPAYFANAEKYTRKGLALNPVNLSLLRGRFELYSAAGRIQEARQAAAAATAIWPAILAPDARIEAALLPK